MTNTKPENFGIRITVNLLMGRNRSRSYSYSNSEDEKRSRRRKRSRSDSFRDDREYRKSRYRSKSCESDNQSRGKHDSSSRGHHSSSDHSYHRYDRCNHDKYHKDVDDKQDRKERLEPNTQALGRVLTDMSRTNRRVESEFEQSSRKKLSDLNRTTGFQGRAYYKPSGKFGVEIPTNPSIASTAASFKQATANAIVHKYGRSALEKYGNASDKHVDNLHTPYGLALTKSGAESDSDIITQEEREVSDWLNKQDKNPVNKPLVPDVSEKAERANYLDDIVY